MANTPNAHAVSPADRWHLPGFLHNLMRSIFGPVEERYPPVPQPSDDARAMHQALQAHLQQQPNVGPAQAAQSPEPWYGYNQTRPGTSNGPPPSGGGGGFPNPMDAVHAYLDRVHQANQDPHLQGNRVSPGLSQHDLAWMDAHQGHAAPAGLHYSGPDAMSRHIYDLLGHPSQAQYNQGQIPSGRIVDHVNDIARLMALAHAASAANPQPLTRFGRAS